MLLTVATLSLLLCICIWLVWAPLPRSLFVLQIDYAKRIPFGVSYDEVKERVLSTYDEILKEGDGKEEETVNDLVSLLSMVSLGASATL